jgi:hypothetical protein
MATVTDIGTLKAEIAAYLYDRSDLTAQIPNFIDMAQKRLFRVLQCQENEKLASGTLPANEYALPADYKALRYILVNDKPMESVSDIELRSRLKNQPGNGEPSAFSRIDTKWIFHPPPDDTYDINLYYYADLSSDVTSDVATNAVLTAYPDLYVWGSLLMAAPYLNEDNRIGTWKALYDDTLQTINERTFDQEYSGSNISVRNAYGD